MDFFSHQDQARKRTGQLVILFVLAVLTLIFLLNILVAGFFWFDRYGSFNPADLGYIIRSIPAEQALLVSLGVLVVVGGASLVKWSMLSGGGKTVAESLGGQQLTPETNDFYEKRVLNIVEEMALAAGMPVPPVYLLEDTSINAFAAGYQPSDAVIGVTRGCMEQLSRDQLQGVIAHEFSHILNGDMRLNIRLMAILFGILFIGLLGRILLEAALNSGRRRSSSSDNKNNPAPLVAVGLGLLVIGYGGVFFGNLIKAAVSRQREFLADASAVQFTRNPDSIAGALKVIGHGAGSEISSPERNETAHLFFGQALPFKFGWFKTHPSLEERIKRVDRNWDGQFIAPQKRKDAEAEAPDIAATSAPASRMAELATAVSMTTGMAASLSSSTQADIDMIVDQLSELAHETYSARALIFVLLLAPKSSMTHLHQMDLIRASQGNDLYNLVSRLVTLAERLPAKERLPLVEKSFPALKQLSENQYQDFRNTIGQLAKADGDIDIFEWCLYRLVLRYLEPTFSEVKPVKAKYKKPEQLSDDIAVVLSYLAHYGHDNQEAAEQSFNAGVTAADFDGNRIQLQTLDIGTLKPLNQALSKITEAYPHVKGRIIKAMAACVKADGQLRVVELDLVRTMAAILESPVPGLFDEE